jgi:type I restriction enzyme, S subunit
MAVDTSLTVYGRLSSQFECAPLGKLCVDGNGVQTGPFGSQLHEEDYVSVGTPILTVEHLSDNRISHSDLPRVSDADRLRLSRYALREGDIVFSRVGSVDRRALVRKEEEGWLFSGRCLRVRVDRTRIDPQYVSWFFGFEGFKEHIRRIAVGATMPSINTKILAEVPIYFPPLHEQKAIAAALGALDDKIELNRRMNATLEAMARALFQSWFVDFDPVRAKVDGRQPTGLDAATADLFPNEFLNSEVGPIPKGWRVGKLGEAATNPRRTIHPNEIAPNTPYIALEHMPRRSVALAEWADSADVTSGKFEFRKGEILFGKLRPYFHKVGVAPVEGVCSTDILVITPSTPSWFGFILGHVSSDELVNFTDLASTGTKMPRTSWPDISSFAVVIPPEPIAGAFTRFVRAVADRIISNSHESHTLAAVRDTLLPKLLNGSLRIRNPQV